VPLAGRKAGADPLRRDKWYWMRAGPKCAFEREFCSLWNQLSFDTEECAAKSARRWPRRNQDRVAAFKNDSPLPCGGSEVRMALATKQVHLIPAPHPLVKNTQQITRAMNSVARPGARAQERIAGVLAKNGADATLICRAFLSRSTVASKAFRREDSGPCLRRARLAGASTPTFAEGARFLAPTKAKRFDDPVAKKAATRLKKRDSMSSRYVNVLARVDFATRGKCHARHGLYEGRDRFGV